MVNLSGFACFAALRETALHYLLHFLLLLAANTNFIEDLYPYIIITDAPCGLFCRCPIQDHG